MNYIRPEDFDVCIYHGGCPDGIGGAYPFWRFNRDRYRLDDSDPNKFHIIPARHGQSYPKDVVANKNVVVVDFCYKKNDIISMCNNCKNVLILDHHATSVNELNGINLEQYTNLLFTLDPDRSGAQIGWDYCYPEVERPWFVEVIADRDLWKWELPYSNEIGKAFYLLGYTWDNMEMYYNQPRENDEKNKQDLIEKGKLIIQKDNIEISKAISCNVLCDFDGYRVRMTSTIPTFRSEVGNKLSKMNDCDFAAIWRYDFTTDEWWISLRGSDSCTIPLNEICEKYGGGGHPKASGFTIYGHHSPKWLYTSEEQKLSMAHGLLHDYFSIVNQ
jgi:oligoribonuclease NrnB/cAMP/cGMP phosphodiesterase (DHH superfamily)